MRSTRRTALVSLASLAAAAVVALVAVPFLFRDRIASRLKAEINRSVAARVEWGGVGLSALADFPNLALGLDRVSVIGEKPFAGDTLFAARQVRLVLDLGSVVRFLRTGDRIVVREIALTQPVARLRVLRDGTANWDIAREKTPSAGSGSPAVGVTLRELRITGGVLSLDDQQSNLQASLVGIDESLRGDFAQDRFTLATRTHVDTASLRFAGVPYLSRVTLALDADVGADLKSRRFTFRNDSLRVNQLVLAFSGAVEAGHPNTTLDVSFAAPSTAFRDVLSLVPAVYARDFSHVQTSGRMSVSGRVSGTYGPNAFPALALRARVENGAFRYPQLPLPARDIVLDLAIDNPGGSPDSTVVNLKRFHAVLGRQPLDASLVMRTPVSDPDVDLRAVGKIDLADLGRTVELPDVKQLSGVVSADVAFRARVSDVDAGRYDRVDARGSVGVARLALRSASLPHPLAIDTAALRLTPRRAELATLVARIGNSDLRAAGTLDNVLAYALRGDVLRGEAKVGSTHVDLDEWKSGDDALEVIPVPANVDFALDASADRVTYGAITAANVRGALRVKDRRVTLQDLRMDVLRGSIVANGFYETTNLARPGFDLGLEITTVDVPTAFGALVTVQKLAPVARWAQGTVSGDFAVKGTLGKDMMPALDALTGHGTVESGRLVMQGAPVMAKLSESLAMKQLANPALEALRASFEIADGRVRVKPFDVRLGRTTMTVGGSNGIDQSLSYDLALAVPRADLDAAAGGAVSRLAAQAGKAGFVLGAGDAGDVVKLGARVTGSVTNPTVVPSFAGLASSAGDAVKYAARQAVDGHVADARAKVDSAADGARQRARAEADRVVADAERQAARIREEARGLAERARSEAGARADTLVARATNPAAQIAAKVAADRMRREADQQAARVVSEADAKADAIVAQARKQADALAPPTH